MLINNIKKLLARFHSIVSRSFKKIIIHEKTNKKSIVKPNGASTYLVSPITKKLKIYTDFKGSKGYLNEMKIYTSAKRTATIEMSAMYFPFAIKIPSRILHAKISAYLIF